MRLLAALPGPLLFATVCMLWLQLIRFVENLCTSLVCLQVLVLPNMASLEALVESKKQIQDAKGTGAASKQRLASRKFTITCM